MFQKKLLAKYHAPKNGKTADKKSRFKKKGTLLTKCRAPKIYTTER